MKMLDEINKKFNFKYSFLRVLDVCVNTLLSCAEIVFLYAEKLPDLTKEEQGEITNFVTQTLALNCDVKVKFKKSYIDKKIIEEFCYKFLKNNYSSMFSVVEGKFIDAQINEDNVLIVLNLNKNLIDYIQSNNIREMFLQSLNKCFIANFNITFSSKDVKDVDESVLQIREEEFLGSIKQQKAEPRYDVLYPTPLFGSEIVIKPEFICNLEKDKEGVALAGVVCDLVCKSYVSKRHKAKGENVQSYYFKFSLADVSGNIDCICFSTKTTYKKLIDLKDGDQILVFGNVKISSKERCVTVKAVSFCELDNAIAKIILEECKKVEIKKDLVVPTYKNIIPTKYDGWCNRNSCHCSCWYNITT